MQDLIWFAHLIIGLGCFMIGGWNLMIPIAKMIIPENPEPGSTKIPVVPIPESIFVFLAGLLLLFAACYGR